MYVFKMRRDYISNNEIIVFTSIALNWSIRSV